MQAPYVLNPDRRGQLALRAGQERLRAVLRLHVLRFGLVGAIGFCVDTATFYALLATLGHYGAAAASFFVAATAAWLLNRSFTFRGIMHGSLLRQWALYLCANSAGACLNRGAFALLTVASPLCFHYPVLPLAVGALSGMVANFTLAKRVVFR